MKGESTDAGLAQQKTARIDQTDSADDVTVTTADEPTPGPDRFTRVEEESPTREATSNNATREALGIFAVLLVLVLVCLYLENDSKQS